MKKIVTNLLVIALVVCAFGFCGCKKHEHTYNKEEWKFDEVAHWHASTCEHDVVADYAKHTGLEENGVCDVCGYVDPTFGYLVSFDMGGHGEQIEPTKVPKGQKLAEPQTPTENGFYFAGWFENEACTNAFDFETSIEAPTTLYAWWTKGKAEAITGSAKNIKYGGYTRVVFDELTLTWSAANEGVGRNTDGYWVGVKVSAPVGTDTTNATYGNVNGTNKLSFEQNKDGENWIGLWGLVDVEAARANNAEYIYYTKGYDWDGDGTYDYYVLIDIKVSGVTLVPHE